MSLWTRIANVFRGDRVSREIDEELELHIAEAVAEGRDPAEARRAFGSALRQREDSRDVRIAAWLDSLRADTVFGWRMLWKRKVTSAAAILSLGLAIGACTSAFRLIDALLLRPLPVAHPERLYAVFRHGVGFYDGVPRVGQSFEYPRFARMRNAVSGDATMLAISYADWYDITWSTPEETEKAWMQYVSGGMFETFGLQPALGRLFTRNDDVTPGAHPVAVLAYDYWSQRFGRDPNIIGRRFRIVDRDYEVVGVCEKKFTGTEPGTVTGIFLPTGMNSRVIETGSAWLRAFVQLKPGISPQTVQEKLRAVFQATQLEEVQEFKGRPRQFIERFLGQKLALEPAAAGLSGMQEDYRVSLVALGVLVALVLLIACANVANLMTAQAAARTREMALRVSIGAGRWRLVQLILVESAWLACLAALVGALFAWRAAPFIVAMINPPENPARLEMPADWRVLGFGLALAVGVVLLLGLMPALRASGVRPASALKGGEDPMARRRLMRALIAAQVAFCFVVEFAGGLFIGTFDRISHQATGFLPDRVLSVATASNPPQSPLRWQQAADHLASVPGIEKAALASFALLSGGGWNGFISVDGGPPPPGQTYFLAVSPGWLDVMRIPLLAGRDFRPGDVNPGAALVNSTLARKYFAGANPVGRWIDQVNASGKRVRFQIVGLIGDARYRDMREPIAPTVYVPYNSPTPTYSGGTFIVRTSAPDPLSVATALRHELARAGFRASNIRPQQDLILRQTIRERMLATLALFFSGVALLLAGIGLYGVLSYSVLQRRREIGIRIAIGARAGDVARRVTGDVLAMVMVGAAAGLALGMASARYIESLLFHVKATDLGILAFPAVSILAAALLAALPAVVRAVRIDPVKMLRAE